MKPLGQDWRFYQRDLRETLWHLREALRQAELLEAHGEGDRTRFVLIDMETWKAVKAAKRGCQRVRDAYR